MFCKIPAPRPPYFSGQLGASHLPSAIFLAQACCCSKAPRPSAMPPAVSPIFGANCLLALSHSRNSFRNASSSGLKLKSIAQFSWHGGAPAPAVDDRFAPELKTIAPHSAKAFTGSYLHLQLNHFSWRSRKILRLISGSSTNRTSAPALQKSALA